MNIYGGLGLGIASPIAKVSAEPSSSSGMSGVAYSGSSTKASDSSSDGTHMPEYPSTVGGGYSEGYAQPKKEQDTAPDNGGGGGFYIPSFEDGESTPKWKEVEPEQQPQEQEKHLDVKKLLEGTHNEGYKLYDDGEGGLTVDPNSKGGVYYGPGSIKSTAPKAKKQTATAALPEVSQIYTTNGDDYDVNSAFAAAQMNTGDNQVAASISGSRGGGSNTNSNTNDAIFGGQSNRATPGYSLW